MKASYSNLMQSRFFHPAFSSAIFDGAVRIYFSQIHESSALKIYFALQQKHSDVLARAKEKHRNSGSNLLVMLYPTKEAFELSFDGQHDFLIEDRIGEDTLLGINGPFDDQQLSEILVAIVNCLDQWESAFEVSELSSSPTY